MSQIAPEILKPKLYPKPENKELRGSYCVLQPFNKNIHAAALYKAFLLDKEGTDWTYLPHGPFRSEAEFMIWAEITCLNSDPFFYTICTPENLNPVGIISLLKIEPLHGKIEVGYANFSPLMQQTAASTEVFFLLMKYVFEEMGYRRLEWKCDNANERSKRGAIRLGFVFEGLFRQHWIIKSRNRDTAWYSLIDKEWPEAKAKIESWLSPDNFDENGQQIRKLSEF